MDIQNRDHGIILEKIRHMDAHTVIGEFAGRDSAAAIIKAVEDESISRVLPMATLAPTEYGDFNTLKVNCAATQQRLRDQHGDKKTMEELVFYSNPDLWSALNGRFSLVLHQRFGFFSPCIGCHAYFHLLRIPFALKLGKVIISGERESHDGRLKINQLPPCLDTYQRITEAFGVKLLIPLRHMEEGDEVEQLLGWDWPEGGSQPVCALSGNYRDVQGQVPYDLEALQRFLDQFLYPACVDLGELLVKDPGASRQLMMDILNKRVK